MVRETRHLWVGNLPENIREDRIREHFKRYGRVQSVKLLPRIKDDDGSLGLCATVAFMDIKSASKAHNMEHKLDERCLSTEYYEPAAIPGVSAPTPIYVTPRFPLGPADEHASFDRTSHFYERREGDAYLRRAASGYHVTADPLRGRARDRLYRNGPYSQLIDRAQPAHHRPLSSSWSYEGSQSVRYATVPPTPEPYPEERREAQPAGHKKRTKSSRSGSESGSNSGSSRSRSRSRSHSHSSSSSSQSASSSASSGTSTPATEKSCSPHSHHSTVRSGRVGGVALQSTVSASHTNNVNPAVHSEDRRPLAICVRNLPVRSSDTSLKDGLFHEYKKHGKVTWVKVVGQAGDRYALVCFKKPDDVEKALEVSHDKLFFGCKIEVAPYQGYDVEDNEFRPYEAELDEYNTKATRTLFIGNLEKDVTASELRKNFEQFGEIIEIDIKKQGVLSSYAFCQYADISSVVKAIRTMDGEHLGNNRIKLGFGKSMPTNCVWVDGVADSVSEKYLNLQFHSFGDISHVTIDRERGRALIYFEQISYAQEAVREMRGVPMRGRKLQVDFASRECQEAFYEHLEKQGHAVVGGERPWERYDNNTSREVQAGRFETTVVVPGSRFTRYDAPQRQRSSSYGRTANSAAGSPAVAAVNNSGVAGRAAARSQRTGQRYEYYDSEYPDRRYRNYDEFSQGSAASHDDSYEQELRDYGYCQRDRGDSSLSPVNCDSEGMSRRSVAVVPALQSVVVGGGGSVVGGGVPGGGSDGPGPHPPDIRHLQKERVHIQHLLQQLECASSGEEDGVPAVPKKRVKLEDGDECADEARQAGQGGAGVDQCYDGGLNHGDPNPPSLLVTTHNHRKSVSEVRRLSDVGSKHCGSRRQSTDSSKRDTSADRVVCVQAYSPHPVCKRRKTGSSASESEERAGCRSGKHSHHHHHHHDSTVVSTVSGGESVDGSRPGTPLCDERPENLLPPSEPRRIPRDRLSTDGPISLPLPRFATQVMSATPRLSVSISGISSKTVAVSNSILSSPPSVTTSPRPVPQPPPSPVIAPPPASPPRPPSLPSTTSSDSELSPPSPTLEERIRSLDEKYEKWSGSRSISAAGGDALAKLDAAASEKFRFRHKLLDLDLADLQPSDIVKSVLAKRSVFDEDSKRLENVSDKYEPREFVPYTSRFQGLRVKTEVCSTATKPLASPSLAGSPALPASAKLGNSFPSPAPQLPQRMLGTLSPLHSPSHQLPKSPFSSGMPTTPVVPPKPTHPSVSPACAAPLLPQCGKLQNIPKTVGAISPRSAGATLPPAKGLQYPFPSHPPVLPTTTVATTTAAVVGTLVSVSSAGLKQSLPATSPTTSAVTAFAADVSRTCVVKPASSAHSLDALRSPASRSATVTVPTTATCTKPSPEVTSSRVALPPSTVLSCASNASPSMTKFATCSKTGSAAVTTSATTVIVASSDPRLYRQSQHAPDVLASRSTSVGPVSTHVNKVSCAVSLYTQAAQKLAAVPVVQTVQRVPSIGVGSKCPSPAPVQVIGSPTGVHFAPKSAELSPKISKEGSTSSSRADSAQTCLNIPTPTSNPTSVSTSSPRVSTTVATCTSILSTVTTVAAASTVTTTVLTNTLASTSMVFVTTTTCDTSVSTACTNFDLGKQCAKLKTCSPTKKDVPLNCLARDKQQSEVQSGKPCPLRKDSTSSVSSTSSSTSKKDKDGNFREQDCGRSSGSSSSKAKGVDDRKPGAISGRRDSEKEKKERELADYVERDKKREEVEKERRRESVDGEREKKKEKDSAEVLDRRKDLAESAEKENADRDRWKERDDCVDKEKRRDNHPPESTLKEIDERERRKEKDFCDSPDKRKDKLKPRANTPASIGCKRRMSSQDSIDSVPEDAKRLKLSPASATQEHRKVPERRDSKDSGRSSSSSSKKSNGDRSKVQCDKASNKQLEDKVREDRHLLGREQHREKSKDKSKKKSKSDRDSPKDQRESVTKSNKDVQNDKDFSPKLLLNKRKDDSETEDKEDNKHKHGKKESREKKRLSKDGFGSCEFLDEKGKNRKKDREKLDKKKEEIGGSSDSKLSCHKKESKKAGHTDTDSEDGSGEMSGPKKHSIFDIVDDGPAYISMYDKVKARSTKNMQKLEEEKRQEKMRENFNLLKQSRAKREEKKRSTSWDEDSDTDGERERDKASKSKRHNKVVISSSSEDGDREERKTVQACSRPVVRIKKEESCTSVKSDSDSDLVAVRRSVAVDDEESVGRGKHAPLSKKGSRSKLISDTSEDDISTNRLKLNAQKLSDMYSAESEVESGFPDIDDKQLTRKNIAKNNKLSKSSELTLGETPKKTTADAGKMLNDKSNFKKANAKNKVMLLKSNVDSSDDENVVKFLDSCKAEIFGDEKQPNIKKIHVKNKLISSLDSSDDESPRHLPEVDTKAHVRSEEKHISLTQAIARTKNKNSVESSDEDDDVINSGFFDDDKSSEFKKFGKSRLAKGFPDFSSPDLKKNVPDSDKCDIFGETIQAEKNLGGQNKNMFSASLPTNLNSNAVPHLEKKMYFENNAMDKSCDVSRKKQHKKKQKRQKNFQVGKESPVKADVLCKPGDDVSIASLEEENKSKAERKRHKRERRKSSHSDDRDGRPSKVKKKRPPKPELGVLKIESNLKREGKIEDIFGPLSDDSDPGIVKQSPIPHDNGGRSLDKLPGKWQVSLVYGSDSDSTMAPQMECFAPRSVEKDRKKKDKKRREKKARESEIANVDLLEAGRVLEAKLLAHDDYPRLSPITPLVAVRSEEAKPEQESDVFRFTDEDDSIETLVVEKTKEKKKKRKKSKEEKQNRREHHHHHHHDKNKSSPDRKLSASSLEDSKPPHLPSPSLPTLDVVHSPPGKPLIEDITSPAALRDSMISPPLKILPITPKSIEKKKPEKFIPGFGTEIDDNIHETAVKSISEFETPKLEPIKEDISKSEGLVKGDDDLTGDEEKPRAIISQEETEDAVAALLGESFGPDFSDCYGADAHDSPHHNNTTNTGHLPTDEEEETRQAVEGLIDMKPDTPQSEPDLQIDTDTDHEADDGYTGLRFGGDDSSPRTSDGFDFSRPPKTPDFHPSYYGQQSQNLTKPYESDVLSKSPARLEKLRHSPPLRLVHNSVPSPPQISPPRITVDSDGTESCSGEKEKATSVITSTSCGAVEVMPEPAPIPSSLSSLHLPSKQDLVAVDDVKMNSNSSVEISSSEPSSLSSSKPDNQVATLQPEREEPKPERETELKSEREPECSPVITNSSPRWPETAPLQADYLPPASSPAPPSPASASESSENLPLEQPIPREDTPKLELEQPREVEKLPRASPEQEGDEDLSTEERKPGDETVEEISVNDDAKEAAESSFEAVEEKIENEPEPEQIVSGSFEPSVGGDLTVSTPLITGDVSEHLTDAKEARSEESLYGSSQAENVDLLDKDLPSIQQIKCEPEMDYEASEIKSDNDKDIDMKPGVCVGIPKDIDGSSFKSNEFGLSSEDGRGYSCSSKEDSGFMSTIKEEQNSDIARESDFSEPESDMKPDNDFVASILASESMNHALNTDDSRSEVDSAGDMPDDTYKEREIETVSVIKETEAHLMSLHEERDPFAASPDREDESPAMKDSLEALMVNKENDSGLLVNNLNISNAIRVDSNFWTTKEVNLDSVIKKVDALCSSDDLGGHEILKESKELTHKTWYNKIEEKDKLIPEVPILREKSQPDVFDSLKNSIVENVKYDQNSPNRLEERLDKEIKVEAPSPEAPEDKVEAGVDVPSKDAEMAVQEGNKLEDAVVPPQPEESVDSSALGEPEEQLPSASSVHEDAADAGQLQETSVVVVRNFRRGRRGVGGRRKTPARVAARRTRTTSPRKQAADSPVSPRRGGRGARGGAGKMAAHDQSASSKKTAADVYEFHDDSEDEGAAESNGEKNRPRLILTIKSPVGSSACGGKEGSSKTPPVVETREEFPVVVSNSSTVVTTSTVTVSCSPAVNTSVPAVATSIATSSVVSTTTTRKSRRLLERDGSRTTVDDVIEDVIRSAAIVTRSAAAAAAAALTSLQPRRSSRQTAGQRQATFTVEPRKTGRGGKRQHGPHRRHSETLYESGEDERKKLEEDGGRGRSVMSTDDEDRDSLDLPDSDKSVGKGKDDLFPESEPVKAVSEVPKSSEPTTLIDPVTGLLMVMRESEEGQYIPVTTAAVESQSPLEAATAEPSNRAVVQQNVEFASPASVAGKPVAASVPPTATPIMHKLPVAVVCTTPSMVQARAPVNVCVPGAASTIKPAVSALPAGPRPLKTHVLHASKTQLPPAKALPTTTTTTTTASTMLATKVKAAASAPITPKAMILQAVATAGKPPLPPPPPQPQLHAAVAAAVHSPQSAPVNMKTLPPVNPKAHLLAAAKPLAGPVKPLPAPLPSPPGPMGLVSKLEPPKAHLGLGQQPMLTGAVASPPLKAPHLPSPQPVVAGASSSRIKPQVAGVPVKVIDPPKVEVSMGGCIVVPTASPQARGQVLQAGLPVSAFEASLHAGSGGVVAELLPNPQFVLGQGRQQSPPPAHQQGEIVHQRVGFPHHMRGAAGSHDLTHHYVNQQLYHQYLRVQQEAMGAHIPYHLPPGAVRSPLLPTMDIKSEPESEGSSPPLELRRPASNGAGAARVAHGLQSPHDRTTDSPQVATVYVHHAGARLPHFTRPYYEEPPPAHVRAPRSLPLPGVDAPVSQPRLQVATPPHASQVPPQADSLLMLLQRYPVMWQGLLALKNDQAAVQMHFVFGNPEVARESLPCNSDGTTPPLRIAQRMRLEQTQVEGVAKKMQIDNEHCMLLALPCGRDHMDVLQQSNNLQMGFITYLQQKQAAGIVNIAAPGSQQAAYVVHIFPSCDFANDNLARIAPDLLHRVHDLAHLLIIIATV